MKIRWLNLEDKWIEFSPKEIDYMSRQKAVDVLEMLSSFRPVVIERQGRYVTDHKIRKQLDGACVSFKQAIAKTPPNILFKELL